MSYVAHSTLSSRKVWDPEEVLQLYNDETCIGYAPSRRRKCRMPIRYENKENMAYIIAEISERNPDPELLRPKLRRLAQCGLCVRFHQYQVDEMVEKWTRRIRSAFPTPVEPDEEQYTTVRTRHHPQCAPRRQTNASASSSSSTPRPTSMLTIPSRQYESMQAQLAAMQLEILSLQRERNLLPPIETTVVSPSALSPEVSLQRVPTHSSRTSGPRSTVESYTRERGTEHPLDIVGTSNSSQRATRTPVTTPSTLDTSSFASSPTSSSTSSPVSSPASSSVSSRVSATAAISTTSSTTSPTETALRYTHKHPPRLPLDEECPICYEGGLLSEQASTDLVWCRSGCGRTVHRSCFDDWRETSESRNIELMCPVCRGHWNTSCDCEVCDKIHVTRRVIEGDCTICLEALVDEENNLAWCKDGCGKSVHKTCFDPWKSSFRDSNTDANCVMCRARWNDECEC